MSQCAGELMDLAPLYYVVSAFSIVWEYNLSMTGEHCWILPYMEYVSLLLQVIYHGNYITSYLQECQEYAYWWTLKWNLIYTHVLKIGFIPKVDVITIQLFVGDVIINISRYHVVVTDPGDWFTMLDKILMCDDD